MNMTFKIILNNLKNDLITSQDELLKTNVFLTKLEELVALLRQKDTNLEKYTQLIESFSVSYSKLIESILIIKNFDNEVLKNEIQVINSRKYVNNFLQRLNKSISICREEIKKQQEEYLKRKKGYFKYLNVFDINGIRNDLDSLDVEDFVEYLQTTSISKEVIEDFKTQCYSKIDLNHKIDDGIALDVNIKLLDKETSLDVNNYLNDLENLDTDDIKIVESAASLIENGMQEHLQGLSNKFEANDLEYYVNLLKLKKLYDQYVHKVQVERLESNDEILLSVLNAELSDLINEIKIVLEELKTIVEKSIDSEDEYESNSLITNNQKNIVLFLDLHTVDKIKSVVDIDEEYIEKTSGGDFNKDMRYVARVLNERLLSAKAVELRTLGKKYDKPLMNKRGNELPYFDKYNGRTSKGKVHNPGRVTYLTLPVSENNKHELMEKYHLDVDSNIYLVIGLFIKKSADDSYTDITHKRLRDEDKYIEGLEKLFINDFNNQSRQIVDNLINDSQVIVDNLNQKYLKSKEVNL